MVALTTGKSTSKQDYATPPEFIRAVEKRFGPIVFDLAASAHNTKHASYYGLDRGEDALTKDWTTATPEPGVLWLNPPFTSIAPFAKKCAETAPRLHRDQTIAMLVTASVGANWFRDHVWKKSYVDFLNGRICFDGKAGYPKDCMLCAYHFRSLAPPGELHRINIWRWTEGQFW